MIIDDWGLQTISICHVCSADGAKGVGEGAQSYAYLPTYLLG